MFYICGRSEGASGRQGRDLHSSNMAAAEALAFHRSYERSAVSFGIRVKLLNAE